MNMSLYQRLAFTTSLVFITMVSLIFWWMQHLEINSRFKAEQELHRDLAAHLVADNPLLQEGAVDAVRLLVSGLQTHRTRVVRKVQGQR